ncbi:unnamed protein product [Protopolystoma xenopodis]|uniref:Uncharacterized protein n=1 Tax=Protopolystoma xenopodis TaxID=117903 RepID=A0A448XB02_9PLAT|nr:unnamed protein product [Protopolystoma xenopodis]
MLLLQSSQTLRSGWSCYNHLASLGGHTEAISVAPDGGVAWKHVPNRPAFKTTRCGATVSIVLAAEAMLSRPARHGETGTTRLS